MEKAAVVLIVVGKIINEIIKTAIIGNIEAGYKTSVSCKPALGMIFSAG